jgi:hypothetical protein
VVSTPPALNFSFNDYILLLYFSESSKGSSKGSPRHPERRVLPIIIILQDVSCWLDVEHALKDFQGSMLNFGIFALCVTFLFFSFPELESNRQEVDSEVVHQEHVGTVFCSERKFSQHVFMVSVAQARTHISLRFPRLLSLPGGFIFVSNLGGTWVRWT